MRKADKFINFFKDDWQLKIVSIVIAIIIFLFYKSISLESRFITVPLKTDYSPNLVASGFVPEVVKIEIKGKSEDINLFAENDITAFIDFKNIREPGRHSAPIKIVRSSATSGIENIEIVPQPLVLSLMLEKKIGKLVNIEPNIIGWTAKGFSIVSSIIKPKSIYIEGPESIIQKIDTMSTLPIDISGETDNFTIMTKAIIDDKLVKFPNGADVEYSALVSEVIMEKDFNNVGIVVLGLSSEFDYKLSENVGSFKFQAKQLIMEKIDPNTLSFIINCGFIRDVGIYHLALEPFVPEGVVTLNYQPRHISIEVFRKK